MTEAEKRAAAKYNAKPEQVERRMARNRARAAAVREGKAHKGDGKDVAHVNNNPMDNRSSNRKMQSPSTNRSFPRNGNGGMK